MTTDLAQRSSSFAHGWRYDVFLNFRGEDTRSPFIGCLYESLLKRGIHAFADDEELGKGDELSPAILKSIEESRIAVVVFSKNYASSSWCLDELAKILECVKRKGQMIFPIFYHVDPSYVRHQRGSYGEALAKQQERFKYSLEKVQKWRLALREAANFSGFHFTHGYEYELIEKIVEEICSKINRTSLRFANYPVGLESRLQELNSLLVLGSDCVKVVGIWGLGGTGKTTLASALYDMIGGQFEGSSFLHNVRENFIKHGLVQLQERLLSDTLGCKNLELGDVDKGISIVKSRLPRKKVLLVLDDIYNSEQLKILAGRREWFGSGSRIIITTRCKHLLDRHCVETQYEVKALNHQEALELFCWNAFETNVVDPSYVHLSNRALLLAQGIPLAVKAIGSYLYGRTIYEWEYALGKYERTLPKWVRETFRVSHEDLIRDMGREIIMPHSQPGPYKRSRLWLHEEVLHASKENTPFKMGFKCCKFLRELPDLSGDPNIKDPCLDHCKNSVEVHNSIGFPYKLRRLNLEGCTSLRTSTRSMKLTLLDLDYHSGRSGLENYPKIFRRIENIRNVNFVGTALQELKYSGRNLVGLEGLKPYGCERVKRLPAGMGQSQWRSLTVPSNVTHLDLSACSLFDQFLRVCLGFFPNLKRLNLMATNLTILPACIEKCYRLRYLSLDDCKQLRKIEGIPPDIEFLSATNCISLTSISSAILLSRVSPLSPLPNAQWGSLAVPSNVTHLDLNACNLSDQFLNVCLGLFPNLERLNLMANNFTVLPACIEECYCLRDLSLDYCKQLREIKGIPPNIQFFSATNCTSLASVSSAILLRQVLHQAGNTRFILPGVRIPEWFNHCDRGGSVSFWVQKKFPYIALCFVLGIFDMQHTKFELNLHILINDKYQFDYNCCHYLTLETDHIILFDLRSLLANNELDAILLENEWNHVKVSCVEVPRMKGLALEKEVIRCSGVFVYESESSVEDIWFTNPNSEKRKDNFVYCSDDLELNFHPFLKKQSKFLDMGAFETPAMHQQSNLGSIAPKISNRCRTVLEDRGQYSMVYSDAGVKWDSEWLSLLSSLEPLEGANMISNANVSQTTMSNISSEKDVRVPESKHIQVQSKQTILEKIHAQVPESRVNQGSVMEEANGDLISLEQYTDRVDSSLNDTSLKATYGSLESEATSLSLLMDTEINNESVNTKLSEKTMKTLQILRDCVSKRFSFLLDPGRSRFMKIIFDYLLSLSADDGISMRMRSVILQLSRCFAQWSRDYADASVKLELTTAELSKVDKLEVDIEANVKKLMEVDLLEDELGSQLASLYERKRELEEHIHSIAEKIEEFGSPGGTVSE